MDPRPSVPVRQRRVWLSPYLLAVALTPAFIQIDYGGCFYYGDSTLAEFELIVDGENYIIGFDTDQRTYDATLPFTGEARVRAVANEPGARILIDVVVNGERFRQPEEGEGVLDLVVPLSPGPSVLDVWVIPFGRATDHYAVSVEVAEKFLCSEQGILDAVATGGGPHTFDCDGPTTVVTEGEIIIDNDVILDGEGNLTIDGNNDHRVISVEPGVTAELVGLTVSGGGDYYAEPSQWPERGAGLLNEGTLTIADSTIRSNWAREGHAIYNDGILTLKNSRVVEHGNLSYSISTIYSVGTFTMVDTQVSDNAGHDDCMFQASGTTTLIRSAVTNNAMVQGWPVCFVGDATLINSTLSENQSEFNAGIWHQDGTLTLLNSTLARSDAYARVGKVLSSANVIMANTVVVGIGLGEFEAPCIGPDGYPWS